MLTNALEVTHLAWLERIERIARSRRSVFVPVLLDCETAALIEAHVRSLGA